MFVLISIRWMHSLAIWRIPENIYKQINGKLRCFGQYHCDCVEQRLQSVKLDWHLDLWLTNTRPPLTKTKFKSSPAFQLNDIIVVRLSRKCKELLELIRSIGGVGRKLKAVQHKRSALVFVTIFDPNYNWVNSCGNIQELAAKISWFIGFTAF